ncbi:MAG: STAS domain-containing protein [Limnobacter sp.]|nr:STAS domain-containing protein [Limnobacter sp.]
MEFTATNDNGHLTIVVDSTRLTSANASGLTQIVRPVLPNLKSVTVDCRRLNLVDSGGLVGLVMLAKMIDAEGIEPATIRNLNPSVEKLIKLSHLEKHFHFDAHDLGHA